MKPNLVKFIALTVATAIFVGCNAPKVEDKKEDPKGVDFTPPVVAGPDVSGRWESSCITSEFDPNSKRKVVIQVAGQNIDHQIIRYRDELCEIQNKVDRRQGAFTYKKDLGNNVFIAEIAMPVDANITSLINFNVEKIDSRILISDLYLEGIAGASQTPKVILTKTAVVALQPIEVAHNLLSGRYQPENAQGYCEMVVSTGSVNGKTTSIYLDQMAPCQQAKINLNCKDNLCSSGVVRVSIISPTQFTLTISDSTPVKYTLIQ